MTKAICIALLFSLTTLSWAERKIAVFVGLCDNATQSIAKVGAKIGDGNKPDDNLYWGCSDGLKSYFKRSDKWKLEKRETKTGDERILERLTFRHTTKNATLTAEAWRGSDLHDCLAAFEAATVSGKHDLTAFIGHNALMDGELALPTTKPHKETDAIILCCMSQRFFEKRMAKIGAIPVLLTSQLMYPGSFLLHDALEKWLKDGSRKELREAAAAAYARNQKIKLSAARGVFAELD
ncbi:hypothetical protein [Haloferula sp.]|uniref:hypothetical protein n=1 Tax=Haloferula sp. TaxID=2497595 RepID=UPI0032A07B4C